MKTRVVLIGNHQLTQLGLVRMVRLDQHLDLVGSSARDPAVVAQAHQTYVDVAVLDMPTAHEDEVLALCEQLATPRLGVVVFCESESAATAQRCLEAGALGVVSKSEELAEVRRAVYVVARGKQHISPQMQSSLGAHAGSEVSPRQRELLRLMADGFDTEDAAQALGVSTETIKTHVKGVTAKLGASGRTEAVAIALRRGIIR